MSDASQFDKTVLDFEEVETAELTDVLYLIRGLGEDRDKFIQLQNLTKGITFPELSVTDLSSETAEIPALSVTEISEINAGAGVLIDGVTIKDGGITAPSGVTAPLSAIKTNGTITTSGDLFAVLNTWVPTTGDFMNIFDGALQGAAGTDFYSIQSIYRQSSTAILITLLYGTGGSGPATITATNGSGTVVATDYYIRSSGLSIT